MDTELILKGKGVYCADVVVKGIPLTPKLPKINKRLDNIPIALDDDLKPINEYFIKRIIKRENVSKYRITYDLKIKKYLSGICYNINK